MADENIKDLAAVVRQLAQSTREVWASVMQALKSGGSGGAAPAAGVFGAGAGGTGGTFPSGSALNGTAVANDAKAMAAETTAAFDKILQKARELWTAVQAGFREAFGGAETSAGKLSGKLAGDGGLEGSLEKAKKSSISFKQEMQLLGTQILGGMLLTHVKALADSLSEKLSPNLDAITGGMGRMDGAARQTQAAVHNVAMAFQEGQERAIEPFRQMIANLVTTLTGSLNPATVATVGELSQIGSVGLTVTGKIAGLGATLLTFLGVAQGLGFGLSTLSKVMTGEVGVAVASLGAKFSWLGEMGTGVLFKAFTTLFALMTGPAGAAFAVVLAGAAALAIKFKMSAEAGEKFGTGLNDQIERLGRLGEGAQRAAKDYQLMLDSLAMEAKAADAARSANEALANGDALRARSIMEVVDAEKLRLQQADELEKKTRALMDDKTLGYTRPEAAAEAKKVLEQHFVEQEITREIQARAALLANEQHIVQVTLELAKQRLATEQAHQQVLATESQGRAQRAGGELGLAESKGDIQGIIDATRAITEERLRQRDIAIETLKIQQGAAEADRKALVDRRASLEAEKQLHGAAQVEKLEKDRSSTMQDYYGENDPKKAEQLHQRLNFLDEELTKERELAKSDQGRSEELRRINGELARTPQIQAQIAAQLKNELADRSLLIDKQRQLVGLELERIRLVQQAQAASQNLQVARGTFDPYTFRRTYDTARQQAALIGKPSNELDAKKLELFASQMEASISQAQSAGPRAERATQFGQREIETVARYRDQIAKARLDFNSKEKSAVQSDISDVKDRLEKGASPTERLSTAADKHIEAAGKLSGAADKLAGKGSDRSAPQHAGGPAPAMGSAEVKIPEGVGAITMPGGEKRSMDEMRASGIATIKDASGKVIKRIGEADVADRLGHVGNLRKAEDGEGPGTGSLTFGGQSVGEDGSFVKGLVPAPGSNRKPDQFIEDPLTKRPPMQPRMFLGKMISVEEQQRLDREGIQFHESRDISDLPDSARGQETGSQDIGDLPESARGQEISKGFPHHPTMPTMPERTRRASREGMEIGKAAEKSPKSFLDQIFGPAADAMKMIGNVFEAPAEAAEQDLAKRPSVVVSGTEKPPAGPTIPNVPDALRGAKIQGGFKDAQSDLERGLETASIKKQLQGVRNPLAESKGFVDATKTGMVALVQTISAAIGKAKEYRDVLKEIASITTRSPSAPGETPHGSTGGPNGPSTVDANTLGTGVTAPASTSPTPYDAGGGFAGESSPEGSTSWSPGSFAINPVDPHLAANNY